MSDYKPPMSGSYKAVFAFSIFMMFVALIGGSKSGIGILLWGYTAWLMYKRKNLTLVGVYKTLLWFEAILGGIGFVVLLVNIDDGSTIFAYAALILLAIAISFGMLKYFSSQIEITDNKIPEVLKANTLDVSLSDRNTIVDNDDVWEKALNEFNSANRNEGLWAKCFAKNGGDENKAKADYLKEVVERASAFKQNVEQSTEVVHINDLRPSSETLLESIDVKESSKPIQKMTSAEIRDEYSSAVKEVKADGTGKYLAITFAFLFVIALFFVGIHSFDSKNKIPLVGDGKAVPVFSGADKSSYGVRRDYLIRQIKEKEIVAYPAQVDAYSDLRQIFSLPWNMHSKVMTGRQVDVMEDNNVWWVTDNVLYVRVMNPHNTALTSVIFSLRSGSCSATTQAQKTYLLLSFDGKSVAPNDVKVFRAKLPFEYTKNYPSGIKSCGDIEGGFAAP